MTHSPRSRRLCVLWHWFVAFVCSVLLVGCAADSSVYDEGSRLAAQGQYAQALPKLEQAAALHPDDLEIKVALANTRLAAVEHELRAGDLARDAGDAAQAERHYRAALNLDAGNSAAQARLTTLDTAAHHAGSLTEAAKLLKADDVDGADELVRAVLAESPDDIDARQLAATVEARRNRQQTAAKRLANAFRKPISLEFRDASLQNVFGMISKVSGVNFFFDKDVKTDAKVNVTAAQTSVEDAVHLILLTNQLGEKVLNDNSVLVYPNTPQKQKDYQMLVVRSFFLANAEAKQVAATLKAILKLHDIDVNDKLNLIVIRDTPEAVRLAEKLVAVEDVGEPEAMLDVQVLEVQRSKLLDLGIQWPNQATLTAGQSSNNTSTTTTSTTTTPTLTLQQLLHMTSNNVNVSLTPMTLNANQQDTDTDLLADPRIRVKNKEKAKIMIGDRVPVITTTSTATGFVSDSVNYVDVGLKLEVQPTIYLDREVGIDLSLEVSSIDNQITEQDGTVVYQIGTRNASTVLQLKDGETQILGGLIQDQETRAANKVPGLSNFPLLGRLFSNQDNNGQKTELVLAITPHLVRPLHRPAFSASEFESGTESDLGGRGASITGDSARPVAAEATPAVRPTAPAAASSTNAVNNALTGSLGAGGVNSTDANGGIGTTGNVSSDTAGQVSFGWVAPSRVQVGQEFNVTLQIQASQPISGVPLVLAFNPSQLQVMNLAPGDFFSQGGAQTVSSSRVDAQSGQIVVQLQAQGSPVAGAGTLLSLQFKAIAASPQAQISVQSATPQPAMPTSALPVQSIAIVGGAE
jgi:general secretion pathway protein D